MRNLAATLHFSGNRPPAWDEVRLEPALTRSAQARGPLCDAACQLKLAQSSPSYQAASCECPEPELETGDCSEAALSLILA